MVTGSGWLKFPRFLLFRFWGLGFLFQVQSLMVLMAF
jgi:hypothetical protein